MKALLYIYLFFFFVKCHNGDTAKQGPYKTKLVRVDECNQTSYSYSLSPDPPLTMWLGIHNSSTKNSLLRGNLTVTKENNHVKLKLKKYLWQDGQWKLITDLNNFGCHSALYNTFMIILGVKYDRENCGFLKGRYSFQDIDTDVLHHLIWKQMKYGRMLSISEIFRGYSTYTCWEFETLIEPLID